MLTSTMEKPKKPRAKKVISEPILKELDRYSISRPMINFSREGNEALKRMRVIDLSLNIILLWLGRHVVFSHYINSEWFGGELIEDDYIFWFKLEADKDKAELFLDEIIQRGVPKPRVF